MLDRGWTGHEYFAAVHLVHMNGRMYDTDLRRMLSPDNYVQDPTNTQNYNRYQYGYNNPLKYSDPNGEFLGALIFIGLTFLKGALIGGAAYAIFAGKHFTWGGLGNAALWGGIGAVASAGIGAATKALAGILSTGNSLAVQAFNVGAHFAVGGLLTSLQSGNFLSGGLSDSFAAIVGFKAAAWTRNASKFVKKVAYYVSGALSGGVGSLLGHGSFGSGAARGAIVTGLNHLAHEIEGNIYAKRVAKQQAIARLRVTCERIMAQGNAMLDGGPGDGVSARYLLWKLYWHYQFGGKEPLTIDASTLDFSGTSQSELGLSGMKVGDFRGVNLFDAGINSNSLAFGRLRMTYQGNNQFSITSESFDFNYDSKATLARNVGTFVGGAVFGQIYTVPVTDYALLRNVFFGGSFDIIFNGYVTIPK